MTNRPYSVLSKGERNALDLLDTDALLAHYEDVYASRFRWMGGPEGMDPSWPERMIYRYGLLGVAEAFGEQIQFDDVESQRCVEQRMTGFNVAGQSMLSVFRGNPACGVLFDTQ